MAEIKIERKRSILPWIIGLVLLVLVVWGLSKAANPGETAAPGQGEAAADALRDKTPPRLRQYALAAGLPDEAPALSRAAA